MPLLQEQAISQAGNEICRFLGTPDLGVGGIMKSGSFVRQTKSRDSDLDIVFWTGQPRNVARMQHTVFEMAQSHFFNAHVDQGNRAVHVDFHPASFSPLMGFDAFPPVNVDIVYTTPDHVAKERRLNREIYELAGVQKEATILACYALRMVLGKEIKSYEVSLAALNTQEQDLLSLVIELVTFFRGRIAECSSTINEVLMELHKDRFAKVNPAPDPQGSGFPFWPGTGFPPFP